MRVNEAVERKIEDNQKAGRSAAAVAALPGLWTVGSFPLASNGKAFAVSGLRLPRSCFRSAVYYLISEKFTENKRE